MLDALRIFVAVKAETNADIKVARKRVQRTLERLQNTSAVLHVCTVLVEPYGVNMARRQRVADKLTAGLASILSAYPELTMHVCVLALIAPRVRGSFYDLPMCIAEMLCSEADALHCHEMVIGGQRQTIRDSKPTSFLIGHSTRYWVLKRSVLPVHLAATAETVMPQRCQEAQAWGGTCSSEGVKPFAVSPAA